MIVLRSQHSAIKGKGWYGRASLVVNDGEMRMKVIQPRMDVLSVPPVHLPYGLRRSVISA